MAYNPAALALAATCGTGAHAKPPGAVECPRCNGEGGAMLEDGWMSCYCCGEVGWVTPEHAAAVREDMRHFASVLAAERAAARAEAEYEEYDPTDAEREEAFAWAAQHAVATANEDATDEVSPPDDFPPF